ncbi:HAMP domain-containing histidine kinase [Patescibacteria group bacterium]|nr:HAMP domain-containing histidine kinase [Patescibacteria group bacterium]
MYTGGFFDKLVSYYSNDRHIERRSVVLNVMLLGAGLISFLAFALTLERFVRLGNEYQGESPWLLAGILVVFVFLYWLSKIGKIGLVSVLFFVMFLVIATLVEMKAGVQNPMGLLLFAFVIILSGILFDSRFLLWIFLLIFGDLFLISYLQIEGFTEPYLKWRLTKFDYEIAVGYLIFPIIIALVSWLYNREIFKALSKAEKSEQELKKERDLLEVRVEQRTKELKKSQMEKIAQLSNFAEYGKSVVGILHDLVNPVTAISLNLDHIDKMKNRERKIKEIMQYSKRALSAANKLETFISSFKNKIGCRREQEWFEVDKEMREVLKFFSYKVKRNDIEVELIIEPDLKIYGDLVHFDQVVSNLFSNSIESYEGIKREEKKILVIAGKFNNNILFVWQDYGCGIADENIKKIFDPFFTSKGENKNIGMGLAIVRNIIEDDFGGTINVDSQLNKGTTFYISLPRKLRKK